MALRKACVDCILRCGHKAPLASTQSQRTFYLYSPEPFHPLVDRVPEWKTAEEAVQVIQSGQRIFVHGAAATPVRLLEAMTSHGKKAGLKNVEIIHIHTEGPGKYNDPEFHGMFRSNSLFLGANSRGAVQEGRADCIPIFLSEIPILFRRKILKLDVALISITPPDKHGFCSLSTSVDCTRSAIQNAKYIIAPLKDTVTYKVETNPTSELANRIGGQIDFIRGAALGLDGLGKAIIAMPSSTRKGQSKIVPILKDGSGVVTTRAHVHYIVTEYGIAQLFGKNLRQRAWELINIAHPDHRESLEKASFERLKCMPGQ
ncbi:hypothetical protein ScPMuIL_008603 [Solemya velum]